MYINVCFSPRSGDCTHLEPPVFLQYLPVLQDPDPTYTGPKSEKAAHCGTENNREQIVNQGSQEHNFNSGMNNAVVTPLRKAASYS